MYKRQHQCSTRLFDQKSAWGTHGLKLKLGLPGLPNTDPNRCSLFDPDTVPDGCDAVEPIEPWLYHCSIVNTYYYMQPGLEVHLAEEIHKQTDLPLRVMVR